MARSEARLSVDIWSDDDFLNLTPDAQRMFMFLLSQRDLAHDGVIALRARRWAAAARGLTSDTVAAALAELQAARFVVVDEQAEELLVRSFIRRDKVFKQPNVLRAAADHLALVTSDTIRRELAVELARISHEPMSEPSTAIVAEMRQALPTPTAKSSPNPSRKGSRKATGGTPGERGVVTAVGSASPYPEPRSPYPEPLPLAPLAAAAPPAAETITQRSKRITDAYAEAEPMCKWPAVNGIVIKAIKAGRWDDAEIRAALLRLAGERRPVSIETLRVELDGLPPGRASPNGRAPARSTTDERVAAGLALAAELEADQRKELAP